MGASSRPYQGAERANEKKNLVRPFFISTAFHGAQSLFTPHYGHGEVRTMNARKTVVVIVGLIGLVSGYAGAYVGGQGGNTVPGNAARETDRLGNPVPPKTHASNPDAEFSATVKEGLQGLTDKARGTAARIEAQAGIAEEQGKRGSAAAGVNLVARRNGHGFRNYGDRALWRSGWVPSIYCTLGSESQLPLYFIYADVRGYEEGQDILNYGIRINMFETRDQMVRNRYGHRGGRWLDGSGVAREKDGVLTVQFQYRDNNQLRFSQLQVSAWVNEWDRTIGTMDGVELRNCEMARSKPR